MTVATVSKTTTLTPTKGPDQHSLPLYINITKTTWLPILRWDVIEMYSPDLRYMIWTLFFSRMLTARYHAFSVRPFVGSALQGWVGHMCTLIYQRVSAFKRGFCITVPVQMLKCLINLPHPCPCPCPCPPAPDCGSGESGLVTRACELETQIEGMKSVRNHRQRKKKKERRRIQSRLF